LERFYCIYACLIPCKYIFWLNVAIPVAIQSRFFVDYIEARR
jgi:hypothetical protein